MDFQLELVNQTYFLSLEAFVADVMTAIPSHLLQHMPPHH